MSDLKPSKKYNIPLRIALCMGAWFWAIILAAALRPANTLVLSNASVGQLENSDSAFLQFSWINRFADAGTIVSAIFLLCLYLIWRAPLKVLHPNASKVWGVILLGVFLLFASRPAHAYYDQTERAEWVTIEANQSAFLIPAVGANKTSQKQFGSVDYLAENKVAAKRVQIPHVKADNTATFKDYYVSSATLYVVDRTPYTREWVDASDRGTSVKKEGFRFESADSINIRTGITISASVLEEDAAKFFYNFGTSGAASNPQDPNAVFASVKYGKSLAEVMDSVVRSKVHAVLAREFAKRKFMDAILAKADIIDAVEKQVQAEFAKKGITIAFVGYAEELGFDNDIQKALNANVIATIQYQNKDAMLAVVEINRKNAEVDVVRAQAATMQKWNGQVNFPFFIPESMVQAVQGWFKK